MALRETLYPGLGALPEGERASALRAARDTPFDVIELVGMAFGMVLAVSLTRYGVEDLDLLERLAGAAANFIVAVPLLALFVGPFLVRRTRRGLDLQIGRRPTP